MKNIYFPDEEVTTDDLFFVCSLIERVARELKQTNRYVVNTIGKERLRQKLSLAGVLHCENPQAVVQQVSEEANLQKGTFNITDIDHTLVTQIPTPLDMGKVYSRLILSTNQKDKDYAEGIIRVYNNPICQIIDNYNGSAYYEPSYVLTRSYFNGAFN